MRRPGRTVAAGNRHWRRHRSAAGAARQPACHPRNAGFPASVSVARALARPYLSLPPERSGRGARCCGLDATFDHGASTVQPTCCMARIPVHAQSVSRNACVLSISRARVFIIAATSPGIATLRGRQRVRTIRIGSGAGYSGDRIEPAVELAEKGDIQYLVFECLGERTVALAQQAKLKDPGGGFDPLLRQRMTAVRGSRKARGIKIITKMGAANPL